MNENFKIYTKTGDDGTSGLIGGTRVLKSDSRLEAYGTVDELNSWIGFIRSGNTLPEIDSVLDTIQNSLFMIGSHLATDTSKSDLHQKLPFDPKNTVLLEKEIDRLQEVLPPLSNFILPGGTPLASQTQIVRTVCRRAERNIISLSQSVQIENELLVFVNRLSDFLFVLSRYFNYRSGQEETCWNPKKTS
jgi:cob(I)alamin adenosyltransferase